MRLQLRNWVSLSQFQREIGTGKDVVKNIFRSLHLGGSELEGHPWYEVRDALFSLLTDNRITLAVPILRSGKGGKEQPWDYPERDWYYWLHLFASQYGWSAEYVAEMDIDDAVALVQEIELDRQMEKEWEYQISEVAYPYDSASKKQKFRPLTRPNWMVAGLLTLKPLLRKIPKVWIPEGLVIKVNAEEDTKSG